MQGIRNIPFTIKSNIWPFPFLNLGLAILLLMNLLGCSIQTHQNLDQHVVMVNGRGKLIKVAGANECSFGDTRINSPQIETYDKLFRGIFDYPEIEDEGELQENLNCVTRGLRAFIDKNNQNNKKSKILFFVHGGLNTQNETIETANDLFKEIEKSGYYPIFINWRSALISSYVDHLFFIRQGERPPWAPVLFPFYLSYDLVRGVTKAPLTWFHMFKSDFESWQGQNDKNVKKTFKKWQARYKLGLGEIPKKHGHGNQLAISEGQDKSTWHEAVASTLMYVLSLPTKLAIAPFLDAFGSSAWDVMLRRTHTGFHQEKEFSKDSDKQLDDPEYGKGGLSKFFGELQNLFCPECSEGNVSRTYSGNVEMTMVGHSAGTLIINEILRRFDLPISNIVYLASASTIRDYEKSVFPFLLKHENTQFYNVVLHHDAEVRDRWEKLPGFIDLPPRGSLLVWIDNFLSKPQTFLDRTLGRWNNLIPALKNTPSKIQERIHVKAFNVGNKFRKTDPQRHEDFKLNHEFWQPSFWNPEEHP